MAGVTTWTEYILSLYPYKQCAQTSRIHCDLDLWASKLTFARQKLSWYIKYILSLYPYKQYAQTSRIHCDLDLWVNMFTFASQMPSCYIKRNIFTQCFFCNYSNVFFMNKLCVFHNTIRICQHLYIHVYMCPYGQMTF